VDIPARKLVICRDPSADGYRRVHEPEHLTSVTPESIPDCAIDLSGLFG
jgi:hypothetical protein